MKYKVSGAIAIPRQAGDVPQPCRTGFRWFPSKQFRNVSRETFCCNCSPGTVAKHLFPVPVSQGGAVLFAPPRKAVAFLTTRSVCQKHGTGISLPAGSDQGYSPWTSPAFLKNCWIKKLFVSVLRTDDPTYFSSCKFPVRLAGILLFHVKQFD